MTKKTKQKSDVRVVDGTPVGKTDSEGTRVCPYADFTRRNLASIRFSRYIAVCSRKARSVFTSGRIYPTMRGFPMTKLRERAFLPLSRERASSPWFL